MALSDNTTKINSLISAIDDLPEAGTPLPPLTNPASASDILNGKEAILLDANDQPVVVTGTLVPPVDTGENGVFRALLESSDPTELVSNDLTALGTMLVRTTWTKVQCPSVTSVQRSQFGRCLNLTGIIRLDAYNGDSDTTHNYGLFMSGLKSTCVIYLLRCTQYALYNTNASHVWFPTVLYYEAYNNAPTTVQFDSVTNINGSNFIRNDNRSIIIRTPTPCSLVSSISNTTCICYVPSSLLTDYSTMTNWVTLHNRGQIKAINEDTTGTVGTLFTPTTSATVDHWDQVDLQSYSVGTIDTTNGSITPTHYGRLLIRGLDSSDNIVHVTYLQIGTGFDEEANLA